MSLRTSDRGSGLASILTLLSALLATSVVAGVIAAGLFMPAVGAAGASARAGVDFFDSLPAELKQSPLAQQSRILDADGNVLATFYSENRIVVPIAKIAPIMQNAQIAIEDSRFREHGGVDAKGVLRAALHNASSDEGGTQGASTITQQYVKLTLQENAVYADDQDAVKAATAKKLSRKVQELKIAVGLEKQMTKDQILEGYLNIAYYGDGAYGVETAAEHYFSSSAAKLTLPQAALLAGIVQQPGFYNPRSNPKNATQRRNVVLKRMLDVGIITQKQHDAAVKTKIALKIRTIGNGCSTSYAPFFCDYVRQQVEANKDVGGENAVLRGGLTIRTTLDPAMQRAAQRAVTARINVINKSKVAAALTSMQPGTGKILAMAQTRPYGQDGHKGQTNINYNVDAALGRGNANSGFQGGSTFKAFTLAAALDSGIPLDSTIDAPPSRHQFSVDEFKADRCTHLVGAPYGPANSESDEHGVHSIREFTAKSVNTAFVRLESQVGLCEVYDMAVNLGVHPAGLGRKTLDKVPSLTLGSDSVAPLTMAAAYAAFADDGVFCQPIAITSITTLTNKQIRVPQPDCSQAIKPDVARGVTSALEDVLTVGTARGNGIGRPAAGKTGTANLSKSLWFVGYTPQLSTAVWFGRPDLPTKMKGVDTGKHFYGQQMFGATLSAPIWADFMKAATDGMPVEQFTKPSEKILHGEHLRLPSVTGLSIDAARATLEEAGYTVQIGSPRASGVPTGYVAYTSPGAGASVTAGTTVYVYPSTGVPESRPTQQPTPPSPTTAPTANPLPTITLKPTKFPRPTRTRPPRR